jgi:hypothetical protein
VYDYSVGVKLGSQKATTFLSEYGSERKLLLLKKNIVNPEKKQLACIVLSVYD